METESDAATALGLEAFRLEPPSNSHRSPTGTPVIVGNDPLQLQERLQHTAMLL